jgi:hypothetical protein
MPSSGMLRHVALVKTDVSEEPSASFIRLTRIGELGMLAVTSNPGALGRNTMYTVFLHVIFEVFTAVTTKNGVFWDVTPYGSCKNRRFGGLSASFIRATRIGEVGTTLAVTSNRRTLRSINRLGSVAET